MESLKLYALAMWTVRICVNCRRDHMCLCSFVYVLHNIDIYFFGFSLAPLFICPHSWLHQNKLFKHSQVHRKHTNAIYIEKSWSRLLFDIYTSFLSYNNERLLVILSSTKIPNIVYVYITDLLREDLCTFNGCNKFHIAIASKSLFGNIIMRATIILTVYLLWRHAYMHV